MNANAPVLQPVYDFDRCRHIADGMTLVLHCHHFASLTSQFATDCPFIDAKQLLADCAEDAFYKVLTGYYARNNTTGIRERIAVAERYFSECGLGKFTVKYAGAYSGEAVFTHSHIDEGWLKKWGTSEKPVNHIGCGYITATFSAVFDKPKRHYTAKEHQSIVCGAKVSIITVTDSRSGK